MLNKIILFLVCIATCVNSEESILCYKTVSHLKIKQVDSPSVDNKTETYWVTKKVKTCCEGYLQVNVTVFTDLDILCDPICEPACSIRQFCEKPGKCSCYPGYRENTNATTAYKICAPVCMDCEDRYCIGPNVCSYPPVAKPNYFAKIFKATTKKPINSTTAISKDTHYFAQIFRATTMKLMTTTLRKSTATTKANNIVNCKNCTASNTAVKNGDRFARLLINMAQATLTKSLRTSTTTTSSYRDICPNCPKSSKTHLSANSALSFKTFGRNSTYLNDNKTFKEVNRNNSMKPMDSPRMPDTVQANANSSKMTQSKGELKQISWIDQNGISVLLPVVSVLIAVSVVMLLLLWHRTPLMVCLRARYYVADDHLPKNSDSQQVSYTKKNQITVLRKTDLVVD